MATSAPELRALPSLREGHRSVTRNRICDTAREMFNSRGFEATTMEGIAAEAQIGRSTLYNHFHDKDQILIAIAEDFAPGLCAVAARLPGPIPSRAEIAAWLDECAAFVAQERAPAVLLRDLGASFGQHPAIRLLGDQMLRTLADQLPGFRRALKPGPRQAIAAARATMVLREVGWATGHYVEIAEQGFGRNALIVAGEVVEHFVNRAD
jgi:AcrR family transcriptional regulator